ncbi:MAG: ATP-dependent DNA helicase [Acidimicrobiales bacterium]
MDLASDLAAIAATLPGGGEDRPGQLAMAEAVARAVAAKRHLVVQAGTGTGKSLAYLLPVVASGRKTVVATATKALQDQLAGKDLPQLAAALGAERPFRFAVLKGRANYLCRQRLAEMAVPGPGTLLPPGAIPVAEPDPVLFDELEPETAGIEDRAGPAAEEPAPSALGDQVRRLVSWSERTVTGDRAELDFEPNPRAWAAVSVTSRECPGAFRCPSGPDCFAEHARARAGAADVVVVNTHLYATHVASQGAVLPEHEVLVLDEVHAVEDVMTSGLGVELTPGRLRAAAVAARPLLGPDERGLADGVADAGDRLERALSALSGRRVFGLPTDAEGNDELARPAAEAELTAVLELASGRVAALLGAIRRSGSDEADAEGGTRRARAALGASHLVDDLHALLEVDDDQAAWVESSGPSGRTLTLRAAPVEIGPVLSAQLWPEVTAVLTSATVPPLVVRSLGLPTTDTDELDVGSPFPYAEHALLYCAADLPDRRSAGADEAVHAELRLLIEAAGGRTLALFTSWRAMRGAVEALRPVLAFPVLAQNDLPKPALVEAFAAEEAACLFATMSFWQGVDVPGPTLSLVAIDRIPFPRPDDPLLEARRGRAGASAFQVVDVPRAATLLAQGAGRLIRSTGDRGVVAVLDRRLATAGYGRTLVAALPPMRRTRRREEAIAFLEEIAAGAPA